MNLHLNEINRNGEFHSILEMISFADMNQPKIAFVVNLDRLLTEGNLKQVLHLKDQGV